MNRLVFSYFFLLIKFIIGNEMEVNFLKDYYQRKNINQIVWFACFTNSDMISIVKKLSNSNFRVSYFDVTTLTKVKESLKINYYKIGVVLNHDCSASEKIFDKFTADGLVYNDSYNWLIFTSNMNLLKKCIVELPINVATEYTVANKIGNQISLFEVYNPSYKHKAITNISYMGKWDKKNGLSFISSDYKYVRRANLQAITLNFSVITYNDPPNIPLEEYLTVPKKKHLDTMMRKNYNMLLQLRDLYNFSICLKKATSWGYMVNGTFNGILGDMIQGIVDGSVAPLMIRPERLGVCEYTVQTYLMRGSIFLRHPKKNNIHNVFLTPFEDRAWLAVSGAAIVYWIVLLIIVSLEKNNADEYTKTSVLYKRPFTESAFTTIIALSQQGVTDIPCFYAGRIVCLSLFLWGLLLFQFYSASIVGSLIAEQPRFINTLKDLAESNLDVGIHDIPYMHNMFKTNPDPDVINLGRVKILPNGKRTKANFFNTTDGLSRVKAGGFAFYSDTSIAYRIIKTTFTEQEICDLVEIELHSPKHLSTVLPKNSPFKKMFIYGLRKIVEGGMSARLYRFWLQHRPQCPDSYSSTPLPVQLQEFSPLLFLLIMGVGIAVTIFSIEIFYQRKIN